MNLQQIKREILKGGFSNSDLSELINYISSTKTQQAKADIFVGADVWVVQKTKRTPGVVTKVNIKRAIVKMQGGSYNVPLAMIEVA
jgi:hypothetical protein|tara:strand:- start:298 stop:555 length:258 start_codon:yes stop_codon:yes gene_type:complete